MKRRIIDTGDGSKSLELEDLEETYHSRHGARQESIHVFLKSGLDLVRTNKSNIRIFEVGFGTGFNAQLTREDLRPEEKVVYHSIEKYPLDTKDVLALDYPSTGFETFFQKMHDAPWEDEVEIDSQFLLKKIQGDLGEISIASNCYDLVYYDAFGPRAQPEMWNLPFMQKMFECLSPNGVFVTYCAKGQVKRDLMAAGFEVERIEGPPGKRHMLRGIKR